MKEDSFIEKIHELELEALKELKEFCDQHNIIFYLRGGSVMGAVKYSGFVPWDDDADIAVPRDQYNRLIELTKNNDWSEKFFIASYKYNDDIHCYFPRVLVKENVLNELKLPHNNKLGLTIIDILPLDGAPKNRIIRELYFLKIYLLRALAGVHTMDIKETVNMHDSKKETVLKVLRATKVHKLYTQKQIYDKLDHLYSKYDYKKCENIGTITGSLYKKEIFPREYWGTGEMKPFVDTSFLVPKEYDKYLKKLYGKDYLTTTPSIDKIEAKKHIK